MSEYSSTRHRVLISAYLGLDAIGNNKAVLHDANAIARVLRMGYTLSGSEPESELFMSGFAQSLTMLHNVVNQWRSGFNWPENKAFIIMAGGDIDRASDLLDLASHITLEDLLAFESHIEFY